MLNCGRPQEYIPCPLLLDPNEKSLSGSIIQTSEKLQGHKVNPLFHLLVTLL